MPYDSRLASSIGTEGLAEPLILFEQECAYRIISGHNRYKALVEIDASSAESVIIMDNRIDEFRKNAVKRSYNGKLSLSGKIKCASAFKSETSLMNVLGIPEHYRGIKNEILPSAVMRYLDDKNASFKIIDELLSLGDSITRAFDYYLKNNKIKYALFRESLSLIDDIVKNEGQNRVVSILKNSSEDESLLEVLRELRYPYYTKMKNESESIVKGMKLKGIDIFFPPYFDGGYSEIRIKLRKKNTLKNYCNVIEKITHEDIERISSVI